MELFGEKYGWNFRIKDKKRAIIYFLPRDNYFKVAFVFGQKATDTIMESDVSPGIRNDLEKATKYAEGRGIRIDVKDNLRNLWLKLFKDCHQNPDGTSPRVCQPSRQLVAVYQQRSAIQEVLQPIRDLRLSGGCRKAIEYDLLHT